MYKALLVQYCFISINATDEAKIRAYFAAINIPSQSIHPGCDIVEAEEDEIEICEIYIYIYI